MENAKNFIFSVLNLQSDQCLFVQAPEAVRDLLTLAWDGRTVIADLEDLQAEAGLAALEQALGPRLLVPEVWRRALPQAGLLIPAALSGGTLEQRLEEAALEAPGRCWLRLEPVRMRFPLPCPTGCGQTLPQQALNARLAGKHSFFSGDLCCWYAYDLEGGASMLLYDTEETLNRKLDMARAAGFAGAVLWPLSV